jgi:hypothetical protein
MIKGAGGTPRGKGINPDPPRQGWNRSGFATELSRAHRMKRAPATWELRDEAAGVTVAYGKTIKAV